MEGGDGDSAVRLHLSIAAAVEPRTGQNTGKCSQGPGGGQEFGGGNLSPEQQATFEARRAERGGVGARLALVFVDPLIELLEERAAE